MFKEKSTIAILSVLIVLAMLVSPVLAAVGDTTLVSVNTTGGVGDASSSQAVITPNGRYVAFTSYANNLVASDMNETRDIFRRDLTTNTTILITVDPDGEPANSYSTNPAISSDGRYVAFSSAASNLSLLLDNNNANDIYLRDIQSGISRLISVDTSREGVGNDNSYKPSISSDGSLIAFESFASNLISDDTNGFSDIFVDDGSSILRVSISTGGDQGNNFSSYASISGNGRYVTFASNATNLVANDTNARTDIFVRDMMLESTTRISVSSSGTQADGGSNYPVISNNGRYIAFVSGATNLVSGDTNGQTDVFVHDTQTGTTTMVSVASNGTLANSLSDYPFISPDGRYVGFPSFASNLVSGDTNAAWDVFLHDTTSGLTERISQGTDGVQGNGGSYGGSFSSGATYAVFTSSATNLVTGLSDTNEAADVFLREPDITPPTVIFGVGSVPISLGATITNPPSVLNVRFSEDVLGNGSPQAANSLWNYMLVRPGANGIFDTADTSFSICDSDHVVEGDDERVGFDNVTYDNDIHMATLYIEQGNIPLANGSYRLYVCGAASIDDLGGNPLNGGSNTGVSFSVGPAAPGGGRGAGSSDPAVYPATGFAPGRATNLPVQTVEYASVSDLDLDIPSLGIHMPVVEVPQENGSWDVSWLDRDAGWLEGSAFPTWEGNSIITGHVYDVNGKPGPFENLGALKWGDRVIIHSWGQDYVYEVRSVEEYVNPKDTRLLTKHEELPWLTLVTCKGYDEKSDIYQWRTVVRAVQIEVK